MRHELTLGYLSSDGWMRFWFEQPATAKGGQRVTPPRPEVRDSTDFPAGLIPRMKGDEGAGVEQARERPH